MVVRPANFGYNVETAGSNAFQVVPEADAGVVRDAAAAEFDAFVAVLRKCGVNVFVFEDDASLLLPDAVFPNNWVTFHADGTVIMYPMAAENRRGERRAEIVERLRSDFEIGRVIDFSGHESENRYLEGTGSIIFDHVSRIAYASLSARTDEVLLREVCLELKYEPVVFRSHDASGSEIYHTNVMMCVGDGFAVVCLESISARRETVIERLSGSGHDVIDITFEQMSNFAGNMLALKTVGGRNILAMSQSAFDCLTTDQRQRLGAYCELAPLAIDTIETAGGGSVRCMIAEIFLKPL